jgi:hypothetical protein
MIYTITTEGMGQTSQFIVLCPTNANKKGN